MLKEGQLAMLKESVGERSKCAYLYNHPVLGFEIDKPLHHKEPVIILEINQFHKSARIITPKKLIGWIDISYLKKI